MTGLKYAPSHDDGSTTAVYYPIIPLPPVATHQSPSIDPTLWPTIAERSRYASLRDLAIAYDVSYETIRAIVRRIGQEERAAIAMAAD